MALSASHVKCTGGMGPTTSTQAVTLNIPNPVINEHANDDLRDMTQIQPDPLPESSKQPMHHHVTPTKACTPSSPPPNGGILTILHRPVSIGATLHARHSRTFITFFSF